MRTSALVASGVFALTGAVIWVFTLGFFAIGWLSAEMAVIGGLSGLLSFFFILGIHAMARSGESQSLENIEQGVTISDEMKLMLAKSGWGLGRELRPNVEGFWQVMLSQIKRTMQLADYSFVPKNMGELPKLGVFYAIIDTEYLVDCSRPRIVFLNLSTAELYTSGEITTEIRAFIDKLPDFVDVGLFPKSSPAPASLPAGGEIVFSKRIGRG